MNRLYLDHNATSPLRPAGRDAMLAVLEAPANPSSVHQEGRVARQAVQQARAQIAALVGADPAWVTFTSGATEANNWVLQNRGHPRLVSAIEHPSVLDLSGLQIVPVLPSGIIDRAALANMLAAAPGAVVSLMAVNNETGIVQPLAEAAEIVHRHNGMLHVDAVQMAGRLPLSMKNLGIDYLTLSSHKIGGPPGVGALVTACGQEVPPLLVGGSQESRRRAGTENTAGIAGFGAAAVEALSQLDDYRRLGELRNRLEQGVRDLAPEIVIFGETGPRVANTTLFATPGLSAETQLMALDLAGIAVGTGAACSSGKVEPSAVLTAMGIEPELAKCAIRVSLGWNTVAADIARFVGSWQELYQRHISNRGRAA